MKKYWKFFPLLLAFFCCAGILKRELWFDEALTVTNFMLPLSMGEIYLTYPIPNNQIIYTMLLKFWDLFYLFPVMDYVVFLRMLSLAMSLIALGLWINLREKLDHGKLFCAILTATVPVVSSIFLNYATALRGYAASWLFIVMALWGLYYIFHQNPRRGWWLYSISAVLAAGTVPTNILALGAAACYALPWMQEKFWRDKRFYLVFAVIPLALILFYAPIASQFINTFKLGEGFSSRGAALLMTMGMYAAFFGLLLLFAPWGITAGRWQHKLRYLIWIFPAAAILILHRAPFPRVFVTLLPVLMLLIADGMNNVIKENWKKSQRYIFFAIVICCQLVLIPSGVVIAEKSGVSRYEDDFFHPWYMLPNYRITETLSFFESESGSVFLSFNSDPSPLIFYAAMNNNCKADFKIDLPLGRVDKLPYNTLIVLRKDEDPEACGKRFNGYLEPAGQNSLHCFYYLRRQPPTPR